MKWYVIDAIGVSRLVEYFDFNCVPYERIQTWNPTLDTFGRHDVPQTIFADSDSVLVIDSDAFFQMLEWTQSRQHLVEFLNANRLWVWNDIDGMLIVKNKTRKIPVLEFDSIIPPNRVNYFIDGPLSDRCWTGQIKNINLKTFPRGSLGRVLPRITGGSVEKNHDAKDYLLTSVFKSGAPHRKVLYNQLKNRKGLTDKGTVIFHKNLSTVFDDTGYLGIKNSHQEPRTFTDYPSMDLYQNSWLEVVPETLYRDCYFISEKTYKPMVTKTPFLMISNAYQLQHLKNMGFKTFSHVINEDYDNEYRIQDRVKKVLDVLEDIIANGSESFYNACVSELEFNQHRLAEHAGNWNYITDVFIAQNIAEITG
jgi:hypothetical protein